MTPTGPIDSGADTPADSVSAGSVSAVDVSAVAVPPGAQVVDDPEELVEYFSDVPAAHLYALADLEEPFWTLSRWFRRDGAVVGLVAFPGGGATIYAVSTRAPEAACSLASAIAASPMCPAGLLITGPVGLSAAISSVRPIAWSSPQLRYWLPAASAGTAVADHGLEPLEPEHHNFEPPENEDHRLVPLGPEDAPDIATFLRREGATVFFEPSMLDDGTFVGIRCASALVAMAGTHVVSDRHSLAAVGAVFTAPSHRGEGLARATTAGVLRRLSSRPNPPATIGLNVDQSNDAARRVYESLGFVPGLTYEEAELA